MCYKPILNALMGTFCSTTTGSDADEHDKHSEAQNSLGAPSRHSNMRFASRGPKRQRRHPRPEFKFHFQDDIASRATDGANSIKAKTREAEANGMIMRMRREDEVIYEKNQISPSGRFLDLRDLLADMRLFHVARMIPKGAHLHIHFNSTLLPGVLLGYAKDMVNMYIWSDRQLVQPSDFEKCNLEFSLRNLAQVRKEMRTGALESSDTLMLEGLARAEALEDEAAKTRAYDQLGPDIFRSNYKCGRKDQNQQVEEMRYQYFRERWDEKSWGNCDEWLIRKLTFSKEEVKSFFESGDDVDLEAGSEIERKPVGVSSISSNAGQPNLHGTGPRRFNEEEWFTETRKKITESRFENSRKSARKAWMAFNGRTKMMKGLFNYETAFRRYTRECLEEFVKDNVQYAEIRPNFMQTNQIFDDSAESKIDNFGTMKLIVEEYERFMKDIGDMRDDGKIIDDDWHRPTFSGMKVIYCTPRSFDREAVKKALDECIEMKKQWPGYIAGFDLVGEEAFAKQHPLRFFDQEFRDFRSRCKAENLDIPFLFHCGETPDDVEGNLETALEFDSKRIGHGYALPEKKEVLKEMKNRNVCVETCPISNMILGLVERMDEHNIYPLLEEKMHCAVSSDNGTLFNSTLSHDFYEVMMGNNKINLYGWKQLARWSIEHSCLSLDERRRALTEWEKRWQDFIVALTEASGPESSLADVLALEKAREISEAKRFAKLREANSGMKEMIKGNL